MSLIWSAYEQILFPVFMLTLSEKVWFGFDSFSFLTFVSLLCEKAYFCLRVEERLQDAENLFLPRMRKLKQFKFKKKSQKKIQTQVKNVELNQTYGTSQNYEIF